VKIEAVRFYLAENRVHLKKEGKVMGETDQKTEMTAVVVFDGARITLNTSENACAKIC